MTIRIPAVITLFFACISITFAQHPVETYLKQVKQIRLLESDRDEVRRILAEFSLEDYGDHSEGFSNDYLDIEVAYTSGGCTDDPEGEDASEIWSVPEWKAARIEISFSHDVSAEQLNLDLSRFAKEARFPDTDDSFVFHDKANGMAVKTADNHVSDVIFFPSRSQSKRLCEITAVQKAFYSRKAWFSKDRPYDVGCNLVNQFADMTELELSSTELEPLASRLVAVIATAVDPENDVLTYNYEVSAGKIVGRGAKVTWELSRVKAGKYTITVGVDDGAGIVGKTITKSVTVR